MHLHTMRTKTIARMMVATTAVSVLSTTVYGTDYMGHWAESAISRWTEKGVLNHYEDGTFKPQRTITRGELAQIIKEVFGLRNREDEVVFTDVTKDKWYFDSVGAVMAVDIMNTYEDGTFRPDTPATREETVFALRNAYRLTLEDVEDTTLTETLDENSVEETPLQDVDTTNDFLDEALIATWASESVDVLVESGVLSGYPDGTFKPQGEITRAEVIALIDRLTAELFYTSGTYSQDIEGNVVINAPGVTLQNTLITGNLYIAAGVLDGDIILENVTVLGEIIVEGGGSTTIHIKGNSNINGILVDKAFGDTPCIRFGPQVEVKGEVTLHSSAILDGPNVVLPSLLVDGGVEVHLEDRLYIEEFIVRQTSTVYVERNITLGNIHIEETAPNTQIIGKGTLEGNIYIAANGVVLEDIVSNTYRVVVDEHVTIPPQITTSTSAGGGGGGSTGGSTPSIPDNELVTLTSIVFEVEGEKEPITLAFDGTLAIEADAQTGSFKILGEELVGKRIETVQFNANVDRFAVSVVGMEKGLELDANVPLTIDELKASVQAYEGTVVDFIRRTGETAGISETEEIVEAVEGYFARLDNVPDTITGQYLLNKAKSVEKRIEAHPQYHPRINELIQTVGVGMGITMDLLTADIVDFEGMLENILVSAVDEPNYDTNTGYAIHTLYKGLIK